MAERQIRHVEDVFSGKVGPKNNSQNILDRKSNFNMFKNKQAPRPPSEKSNLPVIGNYKPKILLQSPDSSNPPKNETVTAQIHNPPKYTAPPLIMGDKNVPLQIENNIHEGNNDEHPVPPQRRKRRAPSAPDIGESTRNNPTFGRSLSQNSDEEVFNMNFEEQGGDIDFGEGIDNPGFGSRERIVSDSSRHRTESSSSWKEPQKEAPAQLEKRDPGITFPYIPPPDYDDEELTMQFDEEEYVEPAIDYNTAKRNSSMPMYKEYEGEDFGKYMQEEDYEFDEPRRPRPPMKGRPMVRKAKAPKPPKSVNNDKKDKKNKSKKKENKRNTIREFTYSDTKMAWGDRTVKSTSAKGRYIKHNKERQRVGSSELFANDRQTGTYEDFLRMQNGGDPLESPNSSDSGVDTGEDKLNMDMYLHSQPKQMRYVKNEHKPSVWQRLTWKFRKSVNISGMESERL
ncbi:hypothetical protein ACF0H5_005516 [Mactra antiquata]